MNHAIQVFFFQIKKSLHHRNIFSDLYVKCVIENMNRRYQCQIVPGRALLSQCAVIILIKSCVTRLPPPPPSHAEEGLLKISKVPFHMYRIIFSPIISVLYLKLINLYSAGLLYCNC